MTKKVLIKRFVNLVVILLIGGAITYAGIQNRTKSYSAQHNVNFYKVEKVLDGDTAQLNINGQIRTVRFIGMDTPEVVDPRKTVQCFGREASSKAHELLDGQAVGLEYDEAVGNQDKYGRLLGYIILQNGEIYNQKMISEGYAHEYTYQGQSYKYQADFKASELNAKNNSLGFWSATSCNGDTKQAAK